MSSLIQGAYDLHIHSAPDVLPRKADDLELAQRFLKAGMAGFAIKSHYFCTAERAELVNKVYPQIHAVGAVTLNSSVGGLNPAAVELAGRAGAKIVWFPTCDSQYEQQHVFPENPDKAVKLPFWANIIIQMREENISCPTIALLREDGKLKNEIWDILDIIAKWDMVLATGHISHEETFALISAGKERGVKKMVVTHVDFPSTFYGIEQQLELTAMGAYMEHCFTTYGTGKVDFSVTLEQIRAVGADRVICSTDLGQRANVYPDEGMELFAQTLLEAEVSEADIRKMFVTNPKNLIS